MEDIMNFFNKELKKTMFLIFFGILTWWLFSNIKVLRNIFVILKHALSPLIIGLIISFILNRPMMFFERNLLKNISMKSKYKKIVSLFLTLIIFILTISLILLAIIPSLIDTGVELKEKFPEYLSSIKEYIENSSIRYSKFNDWIQNIDVNSIKDGVTDFIKGGLFNWLGSTFSIASSIFGSIVSFSLGFVFSIYFLLQKDQIIVGLKEFIYAVFPLSVSDRIIYIGTLTNNAFSDFLLGQSLEAVILGTLFFITMLIFKFPYSTMISIVIGVFSFIPLIGAFVGLFVGIILIFVESPKLVGLFIILFLVLQQIEGNFIYPRVVGKFSGLSPLWTLIAVTLGGSLMGIVGIILFVPLFVVIQKLLNEFVDNRLPNNL